MGKVQLSNHERAPGWKLGTGRRFSGADIRNAEAVPGPGQYALYNAVGKQVVSNKPTVPSAAFPRDGAKLRPQVGAWGPPPALHMSTCEPVQATSAGLTVAMSDKLAAPPVPVTWLPVQGSAAVAGASGGLSMMPTTTRLQSSLALGKLKAPEHAWQPAARRRA